MLSLLIFASSGLAFSCNLFLDSFARKVATIAFIAFPEFCYQMEFHVQADVIPIGYCLGISSFILFRKAEERKTGRIGVFCAATVLSVFSLSIYQPIILFPICMTLTAFVANLLTESSLRHSIRSISRCAMMLLTALLIYEFISKALMHVPGVVDGGSYFKNQFMWSREQYSETMARVLHEIAGSASGTEYYGENLYSVSLIPFFIVVFFSSRTGWLRTFLIASTATMILFLPFSIVMVMGSTQPARTFVVQGASSSALWGLAFLARPWLAVRHKSIVVFGCCAYVLVAAFLSSRLAFTDYIQWRADTSTGTRLIASLYQSYPQFDESDRAVYFYGAYNRPNFWRHSNFDMFGVSFFAWDGGNTDRITTFLTASGIADLHSPVASIRPDLAIAARQLPIWPRSGAMKIYNNVLVVRIGK